MNKTDPNKFTITNDVSLQRTYARNELHAKSVGCKIVDPQLYELERRGKFGQEICYIVLNNLVWLAAGIIVGVVMWTKYAMSIA